MSREETAAMLDKFDKNVRAIKKEILSLAWHSRGCSADDIANFSQMDMEIARELIEKRMETTSKTRLPYF